MLKVTYREIECDDKLALPEVHPFTSHAGGNKDVDSVAGEGLKHLTLFLQG